MARQAQSGKPASFGVVSAPPGRIGYYDGKLRPEPEIPDVLPPAIGEAMQSFTAAIEQFNTDLDELIGRIDPILTPEGVDGGEAVRGNASGGPAISKIAIHIGMLTGRVQEASAKVLRVERRVEL